MREVIVQSSGGNGLGRQAKGVLIKCTGEGKNGDVGSDDGIGIYSQDKQKE